MKTNNNNNATVNNVTEERKEMENINSSIAEVITKGKKMTKKDWFNIFIAMVNSDACSDFQYKTDAIKFLDNEISLLDKKTAKAKESKVDGVNAKIKEIIKDVLTEKGRDQGLTISQLLEDDRLKEYKEETKKDVFETKKMSSQKLSALANQLCNDGELEKVIEKKVSYFKIAWN